MNKDLLSSKDIERDEILNLFALSTKLKKNRYLYRNYLKGKNILMIFDKPSTRTKISFFVGISELGGIPLTINSSELQLGRGETIEDTARTLSRYSHGIVIRTYEQSKVEMLAKYFDYPVINALTNYEHPCQALADTFTIYERFRSFDLKVVYLGDFNNVARSLFITLSKLGTRELVFSGPAEFFDSKIQEDVYKYSGSKTKFYFELDPKKAVLNADVVYTDVWVSMGFENEKESRERVMLPYQVNSEIMSLTGKNAIFMHCLPAKRGKEVTDEVIDSSYSVVFDQAENRLHTQKALLVMLYEKF
ncbi:MAG: ornithine carbamoyltransferase [Brevinematales bacterium]|nr:ornithine carbamoyltransferase [Brevinematales bacterium]